MSLMKRRELWEKALLPAHCDGLGLGLRHVQGTDNTLDFIQHRQRVNNLVVAIDCLQPLMSPVVRVQFSRDYTWTFSDRIKYEETEGCEQFTSTTCVYERPISTGYETKRYVT